jgi:hypothetical protein
MTCDANIDIAFSNERRYVSSREEDTVILSDPDDIATLPVYTQSNWMIHYKANIKSVVSPELDIRACNRQCSLASSSTHPISGLTHPPTIRCIFREVCLYDMPEKEFDNMYLYTGRTFLWDCKQQAAINCFGV